MYSKFEKFFCSRITDWCGPVFNLLFIGAMMWLIHSSSFAYWHIIFWGFGIGVITNIVWEGFKEFYQRSRTDRMKNGENLRIFNQAAQFIRITFIIGIFTLGFAIMLADKHDSTEVHVYYLTTPPTYQFK